MVLPPAAIGMIVANTKQGRKWPLFCLRRDHANQLPIKFHFFPPAWLLCAILGINGSAVRTIVAVWEDHLEVAPAPHSSDLKDRLTNLRSLPSRFSNKRVEFITNHCAIFKRLPWKRRVGQRKL
jgi:hypothetical protein